MKRYAEQAARDADVLKELGFVWDHYWTEWNERIFPVLETFKMVNGHNNIPHSFVVPSTKPWPKKSHGLSIGEIVYHIRTNCNYFDQISRNVDRFASLGFELLKKKRNQRVEPILATFEVLHGHRDIPIDFVVPSEAP
ncbi:hypothetical protein P3T76_001898 [Phytophthora citrophthora]|uniref:Uncharacterized protein n=1 Tax=Phytophthora citrophthora TaxID=4793 RepID=A0AAD9GWL7_9STRA|nr:hypothetical protein P3T76_001898 [Phytophthora citrophthora]